MNRERTAYTGWLTGRDHQLFHVLLDSLPEQTRAEVIDALARGELLRHPIESEVAAADTADRDSHAA